MGRITTSRHVVRIGRAPAQSCEDVACEEPLEIRVRGRPLAITMRTPGNDFDLAAGFLAGEGVISEARHLHSLRYCAGARAEGGNPYNILNADLAPDVASPAASLERAFYTTSSCGLCGKASVEAVRTTARWSVAADLPWVDPDLLTSFPVRLRAHQAVFDRTGGVHGAALFATDGTLLCVREDVGRHNAVDKVVGWAVRANRLPLQGTVLLVSGRASFELVQKAWMAGIPVLAAVSAPSSLAVDLATEAGMTLIGFLRGATMNVYAGAHRLRSVKDGDAFGPPRRSVVDQG